MRVDLNTLRVDREIFEKTGRPQVSGYDGNGNSNGNVAKQKGQ